MPWGETSVSPWDPFTLTLLVTHFSLKGTLFYLVPGLLMVAADGLFSFHVPIYTTRTAKAGPNRLPQSGGSSYGILTLLILVVTMRSWIQMGLVSYIPFYYINYLKGDPLLAGKMVTTFLISGTLGTLLGAPLGGPLGAQALSDPDHAGHDPVDGLVFPGPGLGDFCWCWACSGFVLISSFSVTVVMAQDLLPGRLGMASGLMVGFAIGTGGLGVTLLGTVADAWGVPAALHRLAFMPLVGLLLCLFLPAAAFHRPTR